MTVAVERYEASSNGIVETRFGAGGSGVFEEAGKNGPGGRYVTTLSLEWEGGFDALKMLNCL
jgi:hypothetical protein